MIVRNQCDEHVETNDNKSVNQQFFEYKKIIVSILYNSISWCTMVIWLINLYKIYIFIIIEYSMYIIHYKANPFWYHCKLLLN